MRETQTPRKRGRGVRRAVTRAKATFKAKPDS